MAATVAVMLALPGVAAASAAPTVGDGAPATSPVTVAVAIAGGPSVGISADIPIELSCRNAPGVLVLTSLAEVAESTSASVEFASVPVGAECSVGVGVLPIPPAGFSWLTSVSDLVTILDSTAPVILDLDLALVPLDGDLAIALGVLGGPPAGVSVTEQFRVVCAGGVDQTHAVTVTNAVSGFISIDGLPDGASCTVTSAGPPTPPATYRWKISDVAPVAVTIDHGTTAIVDIVRVLEPVAAPEGVAQFSVTVFGAPSAGLTGSMLVGLECEGAEYAVEVVFAGSATGVGSITGIAVPADCLARAQSLPPIPSGYSWYGASPFELAMVSLTAGTGTSVTLFGRVTAPVVTTTTTTTPSRPPATRTSSFTPVSTTTTVGARVTPTPPPATTFTPVEAPTLAMPDEILTTGSQEDAAAAPSVAEMWILATVGIILVLLGLVIAAMIALRIVARNRDPRLAYA